MEGQKLKEGKARVRAQLIDPLVRKGIVRKCGVTVADLQATMDSVQGRLAYVTPQNLEALAETVKLLGEGKDKDA